MQVLGFASWGPFQAQAAYNSTALYDIGRSEGGTCTWRRRRAFRGRGAGREQHGAAVRVGGIDEAVAVIIQAVAARGGRLRRAGVAADGDHGSAVVCRDLQLPDSEARGSMVEGLPGRNARQPEGVVVVGVGTALPRVDDCLACM